MPVVICSLCKKQFNKKQSQILLSKRHYCSLDCSKQGRRNGKIVRCDICCKDVYKSQKEIKRSKSKKYFCSKKCQIRWRNVQYIRALHGNYVDGRYSYKSILSRNNVPAICNLCRTSDRRILAVHHIDYNHYNNSIENLAWLCHNCHFLVHHDKLEKVRFMEKIKI